MKYKFEHVSIILSTLNRECKLVNERSVFITVADIVWNVEQFAFIDWRFLKKRKKNKVTRDHAENENEEERKDEFHADSMINYARLQHLRSFSGGHFHLASNYRFYPVALRLKITLLLFCNEKYY